MFLAKIVLEKKNLHVALVLSATRSQGSEHHFQQEDGDYTITHRVQKWKKKGKSLQVKESPI